MRVSVCLPRLFILGALIVSVIRMADFVNLQPDEKIVERIKPLPAVKLMWLSIMLFVVLLVTVWALAASAASPGSALLAVATLLAILVAVAWILTNNRYENQEYMVTNKRVIYKHGMLGYQIHSSPLERITDVIVSRTFLENLFGFGSILVQTMAGQISKGRGGAEASLEAVPEPEKLQETIFELIKRKRKDEKLTF
ncbi:hypothetical protein COT29_00205 [Candidatus Micrarchaeota archaeon CG08_land_8_20_14_0_20_59_11]|nr:MAG: hypothetical protein COT29_00205 [Candidatus Micrarchaeota archaeon CG08_land_8_20_14_0_20_59_11]